MTVPVQPVSKTLDTGKVKKDIQSFGQGLFAQASPRAHLL
jgi:hypothetical protein